MGLEYVFNAPAYVNFGRGSRNDVGYFLQKWGATGKILLVHGKNVKKSGLIDDVEESIIDSEFEIITFDKVLPDAPVEVIREGVELARKENVSAVVAVGGGSAMDIAKAISVMINNKGDILKYVGVDVIPKKRECVFIAIPTTCGTGSEMTDGGVVYDTKKERKVPFWDVFAGPDVAILDPYMLENLPQHLLASTALDAFAHCAESYTGLMSNPMSDAIALGGIELITKYAPNAYNEKNKDEALEMLLTASTMAGMAFNRSNVHVGHAIAHSAGAVSHIHHGTACALALPYVIKTQAEVIPEKVLKIGLAMGMDLKDSDLSNVGQLVSEHIANFTKELGITKLSDYGVELSQLDKIVEYSCKDILQMIAPRKPKPDELKEYLVSIF